MSKYKIFFNNIIFIIIILAHGARKNLVYIYTIGRKHDQNVKDQFWKCVKRHYM